MQPEERQKRIEEHLQKVEFVSLDELAEKLGASVSTVRRDVTVLEAAGTVKRTHGGARLANLKSDEYVEAGVPIIRLQNVDRNGFIEKNMRFITPQKARELSGHAFRAGDIVISKLGDPLGMFGG